jgi:hypothetical protein
MAYLTKETESKYTSGTIKDGLEFCLTDCLGVSAEMERKVSEEPLRLSG